MATAARELDRARILAYRRRVGSLDRRLPYGPDALSRVAWAGLQDSVPRAAVLSVHARVEDTPPNAWEDPAFVQVWGPRWAVFVVPAEDHGIFTLGTLPDDPAGRRRSEELARRLHAYLDGRRTTYPRPSRSATALEAPCCVMPRCAAIPPTVAGPTWRSWNT